MKFVDSDLVGKLSDAKGDTLLSTLATLASTKRTINDATAINRLVDTSVFKRHMAARDRVLSHEINALGNGVFCL